MRFISTTLALNAASAHAGVGEEQHHEQHRENDVQGDHLAPLKNVADELLTDNRPVSCHRPPPSGQSDPLPAGGGPDRHQSRARSTASRTIRPGVLSSAETRWASTKGASQTMSSRLAVVR